MQGNMESTKIMTARFEPDNSDTFAFLVDLTSEELKRKRCVIEIAFIDGQTKKPIRIADHNEYTQFANEQSEICISVPVKREVFAGKKMRVAVPYDIFVELIPNRRITAQVALFVKEEDEPLETATFDLMVNLGKKFTLYSLDKYAKYLKTIGTEQEKLAFALSQVEKGNQDHELFSAVLELLNDLAEGTNNAVAQYTLYNIYKDESFGVFNAVTAVNWLKRSAASGYDKAVRELENAQNLEDIQKSGDQNALMLYKKAAENGDVDAQYTMYEYYSRPGEDADEMLSAHWLKLAAANGHPKAVERLFDIYNDAFVSDASVADYLSVIEMAAAKNCGEAQLKLFYVYFIGECMGRSVGIDKKYAVDNLLKAANNRCFSACYKIWSLYVGGNDLLMDEETAISWLKVAADNHVAEALNDLGELYIEGKGVPKDNAKGIEYILKAAELNNYGAQLKVYGMYRAGRYKDVLLQKDVEKALSGLTGDAERGNPIAQLTLWELYKKDNEVMFTRQEAIGWLIKADILDYYPASYELANVYLTGEYTDIDLQRGAALLEKAAKHNECKSQFALYQLYYSGEYHALRTEVNKERSYKWLLLSSKSYALAQYQMWVLFKSGNEMGLDDNEALNYLFEAVKNENPPAMYDIGVLYFKGDMVTKNVEKGISFIEQAMKLCYPKAIYALSKIKSDGMCEGEPVEKDEDEGERLLKLSAEYGYAPACYEVWELSQRNEGIRIEDTWARKLLETAAVQGFAPAIKALKALKAAS